MIIKIFVFIALLRVLVTTDAPLLCSGVYAIAVLLLGLAFGQPLSFVLIRTGAVFALSVVEGKGMAKFGRVCHAYHLCI